MADITLTNYPYSDDAKLIATNVGENLYAPMSPESSFEEINGHLNNSNRSSLTLPIDEVWELTTDHIQHGALSGGQSVGATANLDYFQELFGGWADGGAAEDVLFLPVSGASATFYLPFSPTILIFHWQIAYANADASVGVGLTTDIGALQFYYDGTAISGHRIDIVSSGPGTATPTDPRGEEYDRVWSGVHRVAAPAIGWHNASIRLASEQDHTRVRVRSFTFAYFK